MRKITKDEFIKRSNIIHNHKYNYNEVEYVNRLTNVNIICPKHGRFLQTPAAHLQGRGCPKCGVEKIRQSRLLTLENFVDKAKEIHKDKYDYSKVEYKGYGTEVCIICPVHGEFWQTPRDHFGGNGCHKCSGWHMNITPNSKEEFVENAKKIHGDKYDYSKTDLNNRDDKGRVIIICPMHGEFWQKPYNHLCGHGCRKCADKFHADKKRSNNDEFIKKSKEINGDKYDYSKVNYIKVTIYLLAISFINYYLRKSVARASPGKIFTYSTKLSWIKYIRVCSATDCCVTRFYLMCLYTSFYAYN